MTKKQKKSLKRIIIAISLFLIVFIGNLIFKCFPRFEEGISSIIPYKYGFPLFDRLLKLSSSHCFMHTEKYFFYISCKELPDEKDIPSLVFSLKGGASLELKSKDFFGKVPGRLNETLPEYKCKVYITHDNINWVIGTQILKNYDMIFDLEKEEIGFDSNCNFYSTIFVE